MFSWKWYLKDIRPDGKGTVFSTFSCGGGSSMGYKRAGFQVLGNVEIDEKINAMYVKNNHPKYNYNMDLRKFNELEDLPEELYHLDILDGSPPCTTFSMAGKREKTWGVEKKFREGQAKQTLDDLFFIFLDTVQKLRPKVVIAENVTGLLAGNAKGYVNMIVKRFKELGYDVQIFNLNSAVMDVPQARRRVFFIANNQGYPKLKLDFHGQPILFGIVRAEHGKEFAAEESTAKGLLEAAIDSEKKLEDTMKRLTGESGKYFGQMLLSDNRVAPTVTSGGSFFRLCDRKKACDMDFVSMQTFPQDYDFAGNDAQYVTGMSVPPNMMANIALEVRKQWLKLN